uniref:Uncharacterized protein n=1 Tax=Arundo donax TaxID=35708 RepID=A0A0A9ANP5_ARUDO
MSWSRSERGRLHFLQLAGEEKIHHQLAGCISLCMFCCYLVVKR